MPLEMPLRMGVLVKRRSKVSWNGGEVAVVKKRLEESSISPATTLNVFTRRAVERHWCSIATLMLHRTPGALRGEQCRATTVAANSHRLQGSLGSEQESLPGVLGG